MHPVPLRLLPGVDLRAALEAELAARSQSAAFVISAVGSLKGARLRLAGAVEPDHVRGDLEILTLAGTVALNGSHLHMSVADSSGRVLGGHVAQGCIVRTTAEVLHCYSPNGRSLANLIPRPGSRSFRSLVEARMSPSPHTQPDSPTRGFLLACIDGGGPVSLVRWPARASRSR